MEWVPEETMTSAQRKLKRGIEHVRTLCEETSAFEAADAYVFDSEREIRSDREAVFRCYAIEQEAPPGHWSLLAGEAIQNLRSSLDHLVYEAAGGKGWTQFPIFTESDDFERRGRRMTKGVPQTVQAIIEKAQPFKHMPEDAEHHPLAILHSLSNLDKHRVLATVIGAVTHEGVGIPEGIDLAWEEPASNKRLGHGRAHISTFVIRGEAEVENVKVEPMFSYDVRIEGRPVGTLKWIGNMVYRTFYEIDRGEKAPLFLPTPL